MTRVQIFTKIEEERERQDEQWGGPKHDDAHDVETWTDCIIKQVGLADECGDTDLAGARERFIKIAALAVAAIESIDRRLSLPASESSS